MCTHHRAVGQDDARAHVWAVVAHGLVDEEHAEGLHGWVDLIDGRVGLHIVLEQLHGRLQEREGEDERKPPSAGILSWCVCMVTHSNR